jgi:hypothetical protein
LVSGVSIIPLVLTTDWIPATCVRTHGLRTVFEFPRVSGRAERRL